MSKVWLLESRIAGWLPQVVCSAFAGWVVWLRGEGAEEKAHQDYANVRRREQPVSLP